MKGTVGDRVRNLRTGGNLAKGLEGVISGPGDQSMVVYFGESPESREKRLELFANSHTRILWEGYAFPFNHADEDFEFVNTTLIDNV